MKSFKWRGIPVNLPSTYNEWLFFSILTVGSVIFSIVILVFGINKA